jgi:hypothetical protein
MSWKYNMKSKMILTKVWMNKELADSYSGDLPYRYEIINTAYCVGRVIKENGVWNTYFTNPTLPLTATGISNILCCVTERLLELENDSE